MRRDAASLGDWFSLIPEEKHSLSLRNVRNFPLTRRHIAEKLNPQKVKCPNVTGQETTNRCCRISQNSEDLNYPAVETKNWDFTQRCFWGFLPSEIWLFVFGWFPEGLASEGFLPWQMKTKLRTQRHGVTSKKSRILSLRFVGARSVIWNVL
jgi:hypothetical protein